MKACDAAVEATFRRWRSPSKAPPAIAQVASISAGDERIGSLIAQAMEKVGNEGVITVEESKTMKTDLKVVEGMQFDRGYVALRLIWRRTRIRWKRFWMIRLS